MEKGKRKRGALRKIPVLAIGLFCFVIVGLDFPSGGVKVENAYVRVAAKGMMSAAYFEIFNSSDAPDTLYQVSVEFAKMAQLHESFRKDGMVGMKEVKFVAIPSGGNVVFKPGGYHVMLMDVKKDLKTGGEVDLKLFFKRAGQVEIQAEVKE